MIEDIKTFLQDRIDEISEIILSGCDDLMGHENRVCLDDLHSYTEYRAYLNAYKKVNSYIKYLEDKQ